MMFIPGNSGANAKILTRSIQSAPVKYKRHMEADKCCI